MARLLLVLCVVLALAFLPSVNAQLPAAASPSSSIKIEVDQVIQPVELGTSGTTPVQVTLSISNVFCPSPGTATVKLSVVDQPSPLQGITRTLSPTELVFNLTQSQYANPGFTGSAQATLSYTVASSTLPNHNHAFNVSASFDGTVTGCQAASAIPPASAGANYSLKTGMAPVATAGPDVSGSTDETKTSPGLDFALAGWLLGAAVIGRRRFM